MSPPVRTEVLMTYDRTSFYIGFRCHDPDPTRIRAHLSDRDNLGGDDWVAVEIDTYNDSRRAFTLFSTALGVQADGLSDAAGVKDYTWDMIYESAAGRFEWGYGVEMAIPFSSLRFQRTPGAQVWGINIVRGYPREVSYQIWSQPYDRSNNCRVCQYLRIKGFEDASPGRNLEVNPTLTATATQQRSAFPTGGFDNRDRRSEAGVTARWGITPNLALAGTLNPDFSQVEADAAQLGINQPFALFYPERRPFFTDGLDFFDTPSDVVYTRTLRDPRWGLKLSGKQGGHAIGAYVVEDDWTNLIFPGSQFSESTASRDRSTATVLRYRRDTWNNSTLGFLATNRQGHDYYNRLYGVDGDLRLSQNDEIVFQFLESRTSYDPTTAARFSQPPGDLAGHALSASYVRKTRYHRAELAYLDIDDEFRADLGFMPQVGFRRIRASSDRDWLPKLGTWWTRVTLTNSARYTSEIDGTLLDKVLVNSLGATATHQTSLTVGHTLARQRYNGVDFGLSRFDISAGITPSGSFSFYLSSGFGDGIDYANTRKGRRTILAPSLTWNLGTHVQLGLSHTYEGMTVEGEPLYTGNLSEASLVYHLNVRMFLRALLQRHDYQRNQASYLTPVAPESTEPWVDQEGLHAVREDRLRVGAMSGRVMGRLTARRPPRQDGPVPGRTGLRTGRPARRRRATGASRVAGAPSAGASVGPLWDPGGSGYAEADLWRATRCPMPPPRGPRGTTTSSASWRRWPSAPPATGARAAASSSGTAASSPPAMWDRRRGSPTATRWGTSSGG